MRIALICNSYPTKKNPFNQIFIKKMEDQLRLEGLEVIVYFNPIFNYWGNANKVKNPFATIIKYLTYIFSIIFFLIKTRKNVDIYFPQGVLFATTISVLFKKIFGKPVISYIHGGDLNKYYKKKGIINSILKYSLNNSDYIISNSVDIESKVKAISTNKNLKVISPGVNLKEMFPLPEIDKLKDKYDIPSDKIILLLAGNSIKRKGFDIFLEALNQLNFTVRKKIFTVMLTNGPLRTSYEEFIKVESLDESLRLIDKVPPKVLNEYYNISDVFIFPSREEPLGLVGIEAMASGTIVIGSNVGGIKEFIQDGKTGFIFQSENSDALAKKIEKVVNSFYELDFMRSEILETVKEHSIEESAKSLKTIFFNSLNYQ
ncbi:MAG: hypothetical protein BalsKO_20280 [Balneolaceae bacterium]